MDPYHISGIGPKKLTLFYHQTVSCWEVHASLVKDWPLASTLQCFLNILLMSVQPSHSNDGSVQQYTMSNRIWHNIALVIVHCKFVSNKKNALSFAKMSKKMPNILVSSQKACIILSKIANTKEMFSNGYVKEMGIENKIVA